jgi:anti-sigma B factor antagonist
MDIQVERREHLSLIEVQGRVDSSNADQLGHALTQEISNGVSRLVLDLGGVDYMSSAGLRELVTAYKRVSAQGGLHLAQPSERVVDILEMAGLDTIFKIYPSKTDALSSF